jgi:phosphoglycolate phosphatase-like HAD superfamily hydrolase
VRINRRRLYVFDIDGTLIVSGGAGGSAMRAAFTKVWRRDDGFRNIEFSGRTDLAIYLDACRNCEIEEGLSSPSMRRFKAAYRSLLPDSLVTRGGHVLPGVTDLLDTLTADPDATLTLGTGNFRTTAKMKLEHYELAHYFQGGGFGDETTDRNELIARAIRSAQRRSGVHGTIFVIGDTPHDITAAKANGCIAVGVTTGTQPESVLVAAGADLVLPTLENAAGLIGRRD